MLVTFPHMGNAYIAMKSVLEDLGVEVLVPPPCTKRTLELGTKYSPELACLPLKLNIGNYIEAIERGAEVIVMAGGCGPCRFGYYAEVQREILQDLGYSFKMVVLERPQGNVRDFVKKIAIITGGKTVFRVLASIKRATRVAVLMDELERLCWQIRPREKSGGTVSRLMREFHSQALNTRGSVGLAALIGE
ncbi:MAG: CoA protein activase, partial [Bacillota bacterium]